MKRAGGFTLVEVIIAIAAIAVLGGFIMQLFVLSRQINESVSDTDLALREAGNVRADFRLAGSPELFWTELTGGAFPEGGGVYTRYYDGQWSPCEAQDAVRALEARLYPAPGQGEGCFDLEVRVRDISRADQQQELVGLHTARYFSADEGGDRP